MSRDWTGVCSVGESLLSGTWGVIWGFCFCSEDKFDAGGLVEGCILRGLDESGVGRSNHVRGKKGLEEVDRPIKASKPL